MALADPGFGGNCHSETGSPTSISRTIEKVFDDSQYTGEIGLAGRKLKEYPKCSAKYDLIDTTVADLSRNRFSEIPFEVIDYHSLEQLNCYHNVIRCLPTAIVQLQNLVYLNMSRNLLTVIPPSICRLEQLQVLLISNNRMVSLPEEIGQLQRLMQLDVSCNEITHLPVQLSDISTLRSLNIRRNLLVELPISLSRLKLRSLDFSSNRIAHIPADFRRMVTLEDLCLDDNPLLSPPANSCSKGLVHIMKFLSAEAFRDERKRGAMQNDVCLRNNVKRNSSYPAIGVDESNRNSEFSRNSEYYRNSEYDDLNRKRLGLFDSGYTTSSDGSSSRSHQSFIEWDSRDFDPGVDPGGVGYTNNLLIFQSLASPTSQEDNKSLAVRAGEMVKVQRQERQTGLERQSGQERPTNKDLHSSKERQMGKERQISQERPVEKKVSSGTNHVSHNQNSDRKTLKKSETGETVDEITRELQRQKAEYEARKKRAEQLKLESMEKEERRKAAWKIHEEQQLLQGQGQPDGGSKQSKQIPQSQSFRDVEMIKSPTQIPYRRVFSDTDCIVNNSWQASKNSLSNHDSQPNSTNVSRENNNSSPVSTHSSSSGRSNSTTVYGGVSIIPIPVQHMTSRTDSTRTDSSSDSLNAEDELRWRHEAMVAQHRREAQNIQMRLEEERQKMRQRLDSIQSPTIQVLSNRIVEEESFSFSNDSTPNTSFSESSSVGSLSRTNLPLACQRALEAMSNELNSMDPVFTIRRTIQHAQEEDDCVNQMRKAIESSLKLKLPLDLSATLRDGVILCHLINHMYPRSVTNIHVPSPAAPSLPLARCRRNVENFLIACRRIGIDETRICSSAAILEENGTVDLAKTVIALLESNHRQSSV